MFVTYIQGIYHTWDGVATLEHYTSTDLLNWDHTGGLSFGSSRIIDPCVFRLPDGKWRMWYKDEKITQAETQLKQAGLRVFHHIRRSDKVDRMTFQQEPLLVSSPNSAAGVDYRKFVKEYVGGSNNGI